MQVITSKGTSINTIPRVFKKNYDFGNVVLDYGGGKYDTTTKYLKEQGIENLVYDPFNRSLEHNFSVLDRASKGVDTVVCANVLNVIQSDYDLFMTLELIFMYPSKSILIQVYEGDKSGVGKITTRGYQRNMRAIEYKSYIDNIAMRKGYSVELKGGIYELNRMVLDNEYAM